MTEDVHSESDQEAAAEAVETNVGPQEAANEARPSVGRTLSEAREARGLSIAEVAAQLRLSVRQVEALEKDDFAKLPAATFLRGFIRNYAKLLQLDAAPLLAACEEAKPQASAQVITAPSRDIEFSMPNISRSLLGTLGGRPVQSLAKYAAGGAAALIALALVIYFALHEESRAPSAEAKPADVAVVPLALPPAEQPAAAPAAPQTPVAQSPASQEQPVPAAAAPAVPAAATAAAPAQPAPAVAVPAATVAAPATGAQGRIKLMFKGPSWVEIKDKAGRVIFSQLNQAGTEQTISGTPPFSLVVGNARSVTATYNDKPVDLGPHTAVDVARLNLE